MKHLISLLLILSVTTLGMFATANSNTEKTPVLKTEFVFTPTPDQFVISDYSGLSVSYCTVGFVIQNQENDIVKYMIEHPNRFIKTDNWQNIGFLSLSSPRNLKYLLDINRNFERLTLYEKDFYTNEHTMQILTGDNLKYLFTNCTLESGLNTDTVDNLSTDSAMNILNDLHDNTGYLRLLFHSCRAKPMKFFI